MQDWPVEVSDGARLEEFIALLGAEASDWETSYWLIDLVLDSAESRADRPKWTRALLAALDSALKTRHPSLVAKVEYWACEDSALADAFQVAPLAREALRRASSGGPRQRGCHR